MAVFIRDNPRYVATECSLEPIIRSVKASVVSRWSDNPLPLLFFYRGGEDVRTDGMQRVSNQACEQQARSIRAHLYTEKDRTELFK